MPICNVCKSEVGPNGYRFGLCWVCCEAESIIHEGKDMYDKPESALTPRGKLEYLVDKGWAHRSQIKRSVAEQPPTCPMCRFTKWLSRHFT